MKLLKRAQITMETIFIYGIISVVVLSGIAALIYFGVLDLGNYLPDKCTVDTGDATCTEWLMTNGTAIQVGLHNDLSKQLNVREIVMRSEDGGNIFMAAGVPSSSCTCTYAANVAIPPKSTAALALDGVLCPTLCEPMPALRGTKLKAILSIEYQPSGGAIWQRTGGELIARVQ